MFMPILTIFILFYFSAAVCAAENPHMPKTLGGVVRSDKWTIRKTKGEEEFEGNVSYKQGGYLFKSDKAVYNKKENKWRAYGNIYSRKTWETGAETECLSDRSEYLSDGMQGAAFSENSGKQVRIIHSDPGYGKWLGFSDRALWNGKENLLTLAGKTMIIKDTQAAGALQTAGKRKNTAGKELNIKYLKTLSDTAIYDHSNAQMLFSGGRPVIHAVNDEYSFAVQGDAVKILKSEEKMTVSGGTRGWIVPKDSKGSKRSD